MENIVCETVEELLNHITLEIDSELISNEEGGQPHLIFLEWCMNFLADLDETENLLQANHNEKGLAVHGYSYSDYDGKLDLFITSYSRLNDLNTILKKDAEATLKRLENFAEKFVVSRQLMF